MPDGAWEPSEMADQRQPLEVSAQSRRTLYGRRASIDRFLVPDEDDRNVIFKAALRSTGSDLFFRHLKIRPDGGLSLRDDASSCTRAADRLFSKARICQAVVGMIFVIFNFTSITLHMCNVIQQEADADAKNQTSAFQPLVDTKNPTSGVYRHLELFVTMFEMVAISFMVLYSVYVFSKFNYCVTAEELEEYRIWHKLYDVCCSYVPSMGNFSAMKTLRYLNPQFISGELALEMTKVEEGASYARVLGWFLFSRLLFGVLGFLAFVVKLVHLVRGVTETTTEHYGATTVASQVVMLFAFVNQFFGITQVVEIETSRLFLFIFGGEDSNMQAGELDRQEAFLACCAHFICTHLWNDLPPKSRKFKRAVAMLTFTHLDIQGLVLDEDESKEVDAVSLRSQHGVPDNVFVSASSTQMAAVPAPSWV